MDQADCPQCGQSVAGGCRCVPVSDLMSFLHDFRYHELPETDNQEIEPVAPEPEPEPVPVAVDPAGWGNLAPEAAAPPAWSPAPVVGPTWYQTKPEWGGPPIPREWASYKPAGRTGRNVAAACAAVVLLVAGSFAAAKFTGSGAAVPSLESMVAAPPSAEFTVVPGAPNGYLTPAQFSKFDGGTAPPAGTKVYAATWKDSVHHVAFVEMAYLGSSARDAEAFATGFYNAVVGQGGNPFPLSGLRGSDAAGLAGLSAPDGTKPVVAVVARSRVGFAFIAQGPDTAAEKGLVSRAARTTGAQLKVDPGQPGRPPATPAPQTLAYRAGRWFAILAVGAVAIVAVMALTTRSRRRLRTF